MKDEASSASKSGPGHKASTSVYKGLGGREKFCRVESDLHIRLSEWIEPDGEIYKVKGIFIHKSNTCIKSSLPQEINQYNHSST